MPPVNECFSAIRKAIANGHTSAVTQAGLVAGFGIKKRTEIRLAANLHCPLKPSGRLIT